MSLREVGDLELGSVLERGARSQVFQHPRSSGTTGGDLQVISGSNGFAQRDRSCNFSGAERENTRIGTVMARVGRRDVEAYCCFSSSSGCNGSFLLAEAGFRERNDLLHREGLYSAVSNWVRFRVHLQPSERGMDLPGLRDNGNLQSPPLLF